MCYLHGIDIGFTRTNILDRWCRSGEIPDLDQKIVYILKVANGEENIIVKSPDITSIEQLRGKKVNFNQVGSGTQMSARDIFLACKVGIEETNLSVGDAFQLVERRRNHGCGGDRREAFAGPASAQAERGIPYCSDSAQKFIDRRLCANDPEHEDYPDLIPEGDTVDTLASGIVTIAYNWPKNSDHYRRIDKFVNAFFPRLSEFQEPPRHEKWKDTVLAANVPGWKRFEGAEQWLKNNREQQLQLAANHDQFQQFLAGRDPTSGGKAISETDRNRMFEDFMKWMKQSTPRP